MTPAGRVMVGSGRFSIWRRILFAGVSVVAVAVIVSIGESRPPRAKGHVNSLGMKEVMGK